MAHPDPSKSYILYTDACDYAIGGILCQEDEEGTERPIQYVSATLTSTQRNWSTSEKEAWGVVYCLDKLRCYLLGADFVVYTDHKPLLSLFTKQMRNTKIQRWGILFEEFGAKVKYRPGANNVRADMLSRIVTDERVAVIDVSTEWVNLEKRECSEFHTYDELDKEALIREQRDEFKEELEKAGEPDSCYIIHDDILYSVSRTNKYEPRYPRILLPKSFRKTVLDRCHNEAAHAGTVKTMLVVQEGYVWSNMKREIEMYVRNCPLCQVHIKRPEKTSMGEMPLAQSPGQIVGLDLIGPLTKSNQGNIYMMVLIDHFSGWVEAYPLASKSNEAVWERFRNDYLPRHGACRVLITDQGAEFKGRDWEEYLRGLRIEHRRTSPYHPQSNGKTERANRTIKEMLRKLINGKRSDWEDKLGAALWAIRTNTSMVTGFSPFLLHHARPARAPVSDMLSPNQEYSLGNRLATMSEVFQEAARATAESRKYNKARLQGKASAGIITVGDHVLLRANEPLSLTARWDYGYIVTKINGLSVDLMHPESGATMRVHRDKIVLTDPDIAWDEVSPRPRRQRQQVKQSHVPKRRDHVHRPREVDADNEAPPTRRGPALKRKRRLSGDQRVTQQRVPPCVPQPAPPPQPVRHSVKRSLEDSESDSVAKRTRSRYRGEKRQGESLDVEPAVKRWRPEQVSLLRFVCAYFLEQ
jgi:transposase InsO family protein